MVSGEWSGEQCARPTVPGRVARTPYTSVYVDRWRVRSDKIVPEWLD